MHWYSGALNTGFATANPGIRNNASGFKSHNEFSNNKYLNLVFELLALMLSLFFQPKLFTKINKFFRKSKPFFCRANCQFALQSLKRLIFQNPLPKHRQTKDQLIIFLPQYFLPN
jgi:hypothetical protein